MEALEKKMQQLENELAQTQSNLEQATHNLEEKEKALQNVSHFNALWHFETKQKSMEWLFVILTSCVVWLIFVKEY